MSTGNIIERVKQMQNRSPQWLLYTEKYFEGLIALIALSIVFAINIIDIFRRAVFGTTFIWGLEISIALFIWIAWLSAAFALRHEAHFRFTLFRKRLSQRTNLGVYIIEWTLWIMIIGILFQESITEFNRMLESGRLIVGTPILEAYAYLAIPVAAALIILRVIQNMYMKISLYRRGKRISPDASIEVRGREDE